MKDTPKQHDASPSSSASAEAKRQALLALSQDVPAAETRSAHLRRVQSTGGACGTPPGYTDSTLDSSADVSVTSIVSAADGDTSTEQVTVTITMASTGQPIDSAGYTGAGSSGDSGTGGTGDTGDTGDGGYGGDGGGGDGGGGDGGGGGGDGYYGGC